MEAVTRQGWFCRQADAWSRLVTNIDRPIQGELAVLVLPGRQDRRLQLDHRAPVSHSDTISNSAIRHPTALETVAIQFVSGPILSPMSVRAKPEPIPPTLPGWPAMLTRAELCQYLGVSWSTLKGTLTVHPIDMGASVVRYSRAQIDDWIATRPPRVKGGHQPLLEVVTDGSVQDERLTSLERVRRRAGRC